MKVKRQVPVPDHVYAKFRTLPGNHTRRLRIFEAAINRALDELGAPVSQIEQPVTAHYVGLWRRDEFLGHLGPFEQRGDAERVLRLWQRTKGYAAALLAEPAGERLTNREGGALL